MNPTQHKIQVMQAWLDGRQIEFKYPGETDWIDLLSPLKSKFHPTWNWQAVDYRIKTTTTEVVRRLNELSLDTNHACR